MADTSAPQPLASTSGSQRTQSGSHRRGRHGRGRGGGRPRPGNDGHPPAENPAAASVALSLEEGGLSTTRSQAPRQPASMAGRGRRGGPRQGRGRGASSSHPSQVAPQRAFGGHLSSSVTADSQIGSALHADAPEFVPGQPVASRSNNNPKPRVLTTGTSKSAATDHHAQIGEEMDNEDYECGLCLGEIRKLDRVWSCPKCYAMTHLKCVKEWYRKEMSTPRDGDGTPGLPRPWRCPYHRCDLTEMPEAYHCWCGKEINPKPIPGLPAHSCGQTCSRTRSTCPHPCPLPCHPGRCPDCMLMGPPQACFCGKHTQTKRCVDMDYKEGWSCLETCDDLLPCGEHSCPQPCHSGLCGSCELPVISICYCGHSRMTIPCDQREDRVESFNYGQLSIDSSDGNETVLAPQWFEGSHRCDSVCDREFYCGHHRCQRACHPQDEAAAHCPYSPDVVSHCPCGKTALEDLLKEPRQSCQGEIPTCDKPCGKPLPCGHMCKGKCHAGGCGPCSENVDVACRCGRTKRTSPCRLGRGSFECQRVCKAQLNCGRHECGGRCCPGEKRATERQAAKRKFRGLNGRVDNDDIEAEHLCTRLCGRELKCGNHQCQQLCHRGPCPSCRESISDDISCSCGRTVLRAPQPCGTRPPECRFDCTRPRQCGHPQARHGCHEDNIPCPPCAFQVEKTCVCGKQTLKNKPCWLEEARCGLPCGKTLKCGDHVCRKQCHRPGECEDVDIDGPHCSQPCGKTRMSCEHACIEQCHAPLSCKEDKPCQSKTLVTCECQRRQQEIRCLSTRNHPRQDREPLRCDEECLRLQRNRRLATALDIDPASHTDKHVPYSQETLRLFRENTAFARGQERQFRVFAADPAERRIRFKPMPRHHRAFLHALAEDFGLDSHSEDPEPHRHVCVLKTPRFVSAPMKTLAQSLKIANEAAASSMRASAAAAAASRSADEQPFNGLLLTGPRFGLTIAEVEEELSPILHGKPDLTFEITFLPSDEVLILASTATASSVTPQKTIETALTALKPAIAQSAISRLGLARSVILCSANASSSSTVSPSSILRREGAAATTAWAPSGRQSKAGPGDGGNDGWSAVAGRAAARPMLAPSRQVELRTPRTFLALTLKPKKNKEDGEGEGKGRKMNDRDDEAKVEEAAQISPVTAGAEVEEAEALPLPSSPVVTEEKPTPEGPLGEPAVLLDDWAEAATEDDKEDDDEKKGQQSGGDQVSETPEVGVEVEV